MKNWSLLNKDNRYFDSGVISYEEYLKHSTKPINEKLSWVKSIFVFVFPYNQKTIQTKEYITAKFAYGEDYHQVIYYYLDDLIKKELESKTFKYEIKIDVNYLEEKLCAYLAGLGSFGKNNLIICPRFGSYVVIGTVLTDYEFLDYSKPSDFEPCLNCSRCVQACPTQALDHGYERIKCLSYLTQYKSHDYTLYDKMRNIFVGCDICQEVCPHNKKEVEVLPKLVFNDLSTLSLEKIKQIKPEEFKKVYQLKTFNFVGFLKILRNILILEVNNNNITIEELIFFQKKYFKEKWFYEHLEYLKEKLKCQSI